jgi:hypothetical protein
MDFVNLETTLDVEGVGRDTGWGLRLKYMINSGMRYLNISPPRHDLIDHLEITRQFFHLLFIG